jgi:hypothetical protein
MNTPHDQYLAILLDLSPRFGGEVTFAGRYPARFQRATQGACQSTSRSSYKIVEGGWMRLVKAHVGPVIGGDVGMDSKEDRLGLCR